MQGVYIVLIIFISLATIPVTGMVTAYLLKKEKIKAEVLVRAEEIQAKNRLDIELLLHERAKKQENSFNTEFDSDFSYGRDERQVREKQR